MSATTAPFFTPRQISGCSCWLDGTDPNGNGTVPPNNSIISRWVDKSGVANNATQSVTSQMPTYDAINKNLVFNSINKQCIQVPLNYSSTSFSLFFVYRFTGNVTTGSAGGTSGSFRSVAGYLASNNTVIGDAKFNGTTCIKNAVYLGGATGTWATPTNVALTSTTSLYSFRRNATNSQLYFQNLGTNILNNTTTGSSEGMNGFSIGGVRTTYAWDEFVDGTFSEFILFNRDVTITEISQIEGYLAWKWGLQANLPATHPYKSSPIPPLLNPPVSIASISQNLQSTWSPTRVSGIQLWLDGADPNGNGTLPTSGNQLVTWVDKSGNANNANGVNNGGTWTSADGAINLNGTNQSYLFGNPTILAVNKAFIFFIVERRQKAGTIPLLGGTGESTNTNLLFQYGEYPTGQFNIALDFYGTGEYRTYLPAYRGTNEPVRLWTCVYTGSQRYVFLNGSRQGGSYAPGATTPNANDNFSQNVTSWTGGGIGRIYAGRPYDTWYQGKIYEVVWFTSLADSDRQQIEGYLAWKWRVQANLPSTHPFKASAPFLPNFAFPARSLGSPASWTPIRVSGCRLWLDGQDINNNGRPTENNSTISTWIDKSGNSRNATSGTAPIYNSSSRGVRFTASSSQWLNLPDGTFPSGNSSYFFLIVFNPKSSPSSVYGLLYGGASGAATNGLIGFYYTGNNMNVTWHLNDMGTSSSQYTVNSVNIFGSSYISGGQRNQYTNGNIESSDTPGTRNSGTSFNRIGAFYSTNLYPFDGEIYEILVYDTLTLLQRQQVEGYLAWKWGLQANLPATHPFKIAPPPP